MSKAKPNKWEQVLINNGIAHVKVLDKDNLQVVVDGEPEIFNRHDRVGGYPMSGLRSYGGVMGDHRMIDGIYDDMQYFFEIINQA